MAEIIGMQEMRYLNLFEKVTKVRTRFCFRYNDMIMFAVPKPMVMKSVGMDSKNLKRIHQIIGKKVRVVPIPKKESDIKAFIQKIINPVEFKDIEIKGNEIIINAGSMNKAALLGRNKRRLLEMQKIIQDYFKKDLRIV
jgi:transcription antitermination factor NusA-like protein